MHDMLLIVIELDTKKIVNDSKSKNQKIET